MKRKRRRKCRCCGVLYKSDRRNAHHQRHCPLDACRAASKRTSQQRWQSKSVNRDYHGKRDHCARVRAWRQAHPGYWRKHGSALQDIIKPQPVCSQHVAACLTGVSVGLAEVAPPVSFLQQSLANVAVNHDSGRPVVGTLKAPLQDLYLAQHPLFVGLVSILTDTLQENIAPIMAKLQIRGQAILGKGPWFDPEGA